ncbi:A/G-specific adenine glycosylase, partial [Dissulfurirhabdus thermomarina]
MAEILRTPDGGVNLARWRAAAPGVAARLAGWFDGARRDLPWRRHRTPWRTWVSEVMLQQTQVAKVVPYFERFCAAWPDVADLAAAPLEPVLKAWEGLGYYARARNLHRAARVVAERHGGRVPDDLDALLALPGLGPYTARAVLSLGFDRPVAVVDGNVGRVLARLAAVDRPLRPGADPEIFRLAEVLLDRAAPRRHNEALMELGALVCRPGRPACGACPLSPVCLARRRGRAADLP